MRIKKTTLLFMTTLALFTGGCGDSVFESIADKNSGAAKREEAQMLIDSGNYSTAISALAASCPNNQCADPDDAQQLAAAYMGQAGLDVLDMVAAADAAANNTSAGSDFTTISEILPEITTENFTNIDTAVALLENIPASERTDDQNLQLAVAQLTAATIAIGQAGGGTGFDANGIPTACNGNCDTTDAATIISDSLTRADGTSTTVGTYVADTINNSITNVNAVAEVVGSDISSQVNDLVYQMNTGDCSGSSTTTQTGGVNSTEVSTYLATCI